MDAGSSLIELFIGETLEPPTASKPERKPPIPANISKNRIATGHLTIALFFLLHLTYP